MTIDTLIMLAGAFVASLPFLGFPNSWDNVMLFLAGIFIISLGIVIRRRGTNKTPPPQIKNSGTFVENTPKNKLPPVQDSILSTTRETGSHSQAGEHDEAV